MSRYLPPFQRGTARGYAADGRLMLTVTAASAVATDSMDDEIVQMTRPKYIMSGQSLGGYAEVVARWARLPVTRWEIERTEIAEEELQADGVIY